MALRANSTEMTDARIVHRAPKPSLCELWLTQKAVAPPDAQVSRLYKLETREGQRPRCPKKNRYRIYPAITLLFTEF